MFSSIIPQITNSFSKLTQKFKEESQNGVIGKYCAADGALDIVLATTVDEIKLTWWFRGDLNKLMERLMLLQAFLVDAGTRKSLTNLEQLWVEKVKKVARHIDDLLEKSSARISSWTTRLLSYAGRH
ncbi:hypothetical protein Dimus_022087 [Dionaea muscipula]